MSSTDDAAGLKVDEKLKVRCFCGQWVTIAESRQGPSLLHPHPACGQFLEDRPFEDFLRELRESGAEVKLPDHRKN